MNFGKKDLLLMSYLRQNARENLTKLSKQTNIPISTIFDKLKNFQKNVIVKHTSLMDFSKLGFNARAKILLKVIREDREGLRNHLHGNPNINSVYKITNGYDFLAEGVFKNIKDVEDFLEHVGNKFTVEQNQVYYIIEDIKKEAFLDNKYLLDMVM